MEPAERLRKLLGDDYVITGFPDILPYTRDYTVTRIHSELRDGEEDWFIVAIPGDEEEIMGILRIAGEEGLGVAIYAGGSNVVGRYTPRERVVIDLSRLCSIEWYDEESGVVMVGAGTIIGELEDWLNRRGWTTGMTPQSVSVATVGGLIAMGGIGMYSSGYGGIEDILLGLEAVIPALGHVRIGPSPRRNLPLPPERLFTSSEGMIGIVTKAYLQAYPAPETRVRRGLLLPSFEEGVERLRRIAHHRVRPDMIRLLDEVETQVTFGLEGAALIYEVHGPVDMEEYVEARARALERLVGEASGIESVEMWFEERYRYMAHLKRLYSAGIAVETMEFSPLWSGATKLYVELRDILLGMDGVVGVSAHIGHIHPAGCGIYFTVLIEADKLHEVYQDLWRRAVSVAAKYGGISHHHGMGMVRKPYIELEYDGWVEAVERIASALDPDGLLRP